MKITKIEKFNNLGIYVDDYDLLNASSEEFQTLYDELSATNLLIVFRNTNITAPTLSNRLSTIGNKSFQLRGLFRKYNLGFKDVPNITRNIKNLGQLGISVDDAELIQHAFAKVMIAEYSTNTTVTKLVGSKVDDSRFLEGELNWHQDESADIAFCDSIALLGETAMKQSATGFVTTAAWYESQAETFKSELCDMIGIHEFQTSEFNSNMDRLERAVVECSTGYDKKIPLVVNAANGMPGLHLSTSTIVGIEGMSTKDFQSLMGKITSEVFSEENIYDHWYQQDNDLLLFDNSITMHRRIGTTFGRVAYRSPYDLKERVITRYNQHELNTQYQEILTTFLTR